ncbi:MAG TPA: SRPBCC family protein [Vicinamibacterales bacterium]|nr:SRPBCC family protein [Vicinamibacterales bacterium]
MISVERAIRIPVAADVAWQVLGDFSLSRLSAGICKYVTVEGEGVGMVRTMHLVDDWGGGYVRERLEELSLVDRYMRYRLVDSGPVPFADYIGSIRVSPAGPGACVAVMTSCFVPVEISDETARRMSEGNIEKALSNARAAAVALASAR